MADNIAITAGSGTSVATDDCGSGGHTQIVKLAISTDGAATLIPAEATNGLDVDVTRVIPGTSATHLGKAEDAAHTTADTGVAVLAVRRDTAAVGSDTDGDYSTLNVDASGRLHTHPVATITKTQGDLFALAEVAINTVSSGSAVNVPDGATTLDVLIQFAQDTTTAPAAGTRLIVQGSYSSSGNDSWFELNYPIVATGGLAAAADEAVSGTENAGATVIEVASTTGFGARSMWVFFKNSTLGNSEWGYLVSIVANTSITLLDGLTNAQTGSTIYGGTTGQAAVFPLQFDVSALKRVRLVADNNYQATGPTVVVHATYTFRTVG